MSIEQEKIDGGNTESSLEQYGVWVKKSPSDSADESIQMNEVSDDSAVLDLGDEDLDQESMEVFSTDESPFGEDFDIGFDDVAEVQNNSMEDDADNTTLTADELLNITSDMSTEDSEKVESNSIDSDLDEMDFDSFMDIGEDFSIEESSDENDDVVSTSDFDFINDEIDVNDTNNDMQSNDISIASDDDVDISFDDFIEDDITSDSSFGDETFDIDLGSETEKTSVSLDSDVSFEDTASDETVVTEDVSTDFDMSFEDTAAGETVVTEDVSSDFDMSFEDTTSENTEITNDESVDFDVSFEETTLDDIVVAEDASADFDMGFENTASDDAFPAVESNSDFDMNFEDTVSEEAIVAEDSFSSSEDSQDMEMSFDDFSIDTTEETVNDTATGSESNDFGEEISIDDIPSGNDNFETTQTIVENEPVTNYDISIEPESEKEEQPIAISEPALNANDDILSQIVAELSNLRQEMSEFKSELSRIKTDKASAPVKIDPTEEGGFFSDYEGDDTIALSGDELNNILTSADFTVDDQAEEDDDMQSEAANPIVEPENSTEPSESDLENEDDLIGASPSEIDTLDDSFSNFNEDTIIDEHTESDSDDGLDNSFEIETSDEDFDSFDMSTIEETTPSVEIETSEETFADFDETSFDDASDEEELDVSSIAVEAAGDEFIEFEDTPIDEGHIQDEEVESPATTEEDVIENTDLTMSFEEDTNDDFSFDGLSDDYFTNEDTTLVIEDKELVEPSLDNINFDMDSDESLPDEIDVPVIEDLVVDSSPVNFFDDEEDEEQKEIDDSAMQYLADESTEEIEITEENAIAEDSSDSIEIEDTLPSEIKDSEVIEGFVEPDSNTPVSTVFNSEQWNSEIVEDDFSVDATERMSSAMQEEIKSVLSYMDRLLESLPEEKISEFAQSEYFDRYKKLFSDLGIS